MALIDAVSWPVVTERLSMRPATPGDAEDVWRVRRSEGVSNWLPSLAHGWDEWTVYFGVPDRLAATLVMEVDGQVAGDLFLQGRDAYAQAEVRDRAMGVEAEIGWVLGPEHQGRGLAAEAARALLAICFDELGLHRVTAGCAAENTASWRVMERVGMRREAHTIQSGLYRDGTWRDGYLYAMLAAEWHAPTGAPTGLQV